MTQGKSRMKNPKYQIVSGVFLLCFSWLGAANASTWLQGTAVGSPGSNTMVGSVGGPSLDVTNNPGTQFGIRGPGIKYFIPLNDSNYGGTYGETGGFNCAGGGTAKAGTCSDYGNGDFDRWNDASGLKMNIWYDTNGGQFSSASLSFAFDDLDLIGDNDPAGFFESVSLSYWSWTGSAFSLSSGSAIKSAAIPAAAGVPSVVLPNLIMWGLGVTDLAALNYSSQEKGGFWIQLGFGAKADWKGNNTAEYLASALNVSPVPLPSAVWLFGTALLGFIGISRRTKV